MLPARKRTDFGVAVAGYGSRHEKHKQRNLRPSRGPAQADRSPLLLTAAVTAPKSSPTPTVFQ